MYDAFQQRPAAILSFRENLWREKLGYVTFQPPTNKICIYDVTRNRQHFKILEALPEHGKVNRDSHTVSLAPERLCVILCFRKMTPFMHGGSTVPRFRSMEAKIPPNCACVSAFLQICREGIALPL